MGIWDTTHFLNVFPLARAAYFSTSMFVDQISTTKKCFCKSLVLAPKKPADFPWERLGSGHSVPGRLVESSYGQSQSFGPPVGGASAAPWLEVQQRAVGVPSMKRERQMPCLALLFGTYWKCHHLYSLGCRLGVFFPKIYGPRQLIKAWDWQGSVTEGQLQWRKHLRQDVFFSSNIHKITMQKNIHTTIQRKLQQRRFPASKYIWFVVNKHRS